MLWHLIGTRSVRCRDVFPNICWRVMRRSLSWRRAGLLGPHVIRSVPCIVLPYYVRSSLTRTLRHWLLRSVCCTLNFPRALGRSGTAELRYSAADEVFFFTMAEAPYDKFRSCLVGLSFTSTYCGKTDNFVCVCFFLMFLKYDIKNVWSGRWQSPAVLEMAPFAYWTLKRGCFLVETEEKERNPQFPPPSLPLPPICCWGCQKKVRIWEK